MKYEYCFRVIVLVAVVCRCLGDEKQTVSKLVGGADHPKKHNNDPKSLPTFASKTICFVTATFGHNPFNLDSPPMIVPEELRNSPFRFFVFTNLPFLHYPEGWETVVLPNLEYRRLITWSRYPKFMAWKESLILDNCHTVVYQDALLLPLASLSFWEDVSRQVRQSSTGLMMMEHQSSSGIFDEHTNIWEKQKGLKEHVDLDWHWMLQQPGFTERIGKTCPMYYNRHFVYDPFNPNFRNVSQCFWDRYAKELGTWRDQPMWAFCMQQLNVKPLNFPISYLDMWPYEGSMGFRGHSYVYNVDQIDHAGELFRNRCLSRSVLVTGGAGFVGLHTCLALQQYPVFFKHVVALDIMEDPSLLQIHRATILEQHKIPLLRQDICDPIALRETIMKHNITDIIHLAARSGDVESLQEPFYFTNTNVKCFVQLLEVLKDFDINLVYASSSSVYGGNLLNRFQGFSEEEDVSSPLSYYGSTKRMNELLARSYYNLYKQRSVGVRLFTVYGPWGRPDMIYYQVTNSVLNGKKIEINSSIARDMIYIDDAVNGLLASLFYCNAEPEIVNMGTQKLINVTMLASLVASEAKTKKSPELAAVAIPNTVLPAELCNTHKALNSLKCRAFVDLKSGIKRFVNWFRKYDGSQFLK